jgi:hypothetical protein
MLIAKMVAVHASKRVTTPSFSLFGMLWFCLSDFIPRAAPALAFIFLMSTKRPSKEIRSSTSHKHRPDSDDYQFVQLPASDSCRHEDGPQSLYFGGAHSNTELMLKSDFLVESPVHVASQMRTMRASGSGDQNPHSYTSMPPPTGSSHAAATLTGEAYSLQQHSKQPEDDDSSSDGDGDDDRSTGFYSYEWKAAENKIVDRLFSMLYFKTVPPPASGTSDGTGAGATTQSDSSDDILV